MQELDVVGHGVEDISGSGILLLQVAPFEDATKEIFKGAQRVLLEGKLLSLAFGRNRREGRSLTSFPQLEADVIEHRRERFGQVAVDGGDSGGA